MEKLLIFALKFLKLKVMKKFLLLCAAALCLAATVSAQRDKRPHFGSKQNNEAIETWKYVADNNLAQITDLSALRPVIEEVIAANETSVSEYKSGRTQAMGYIMGQAMRALKGKAPAQEVQKILHELLDS